MQVQGSSSFFSVGETISQGWIKASITWSQKSLTLDIERSDIFIPPDYIFAFFIDFLSRWFVNVVVWLLFACHFTFPQPSAFLATPSDCQKWVAMPVGTSNKAQGFESFCLAYCWRCFGTELGSSLCESFAGPTTPYMLGKQSNKACQSATKHDYVPLKMCKATRITQPSKKIHNHPAHEHTEKNI